MSTQRVVGQALPRLDGRAKVTGEYIYGMDFTMPGMLHGKVLRSPHPHARIVETDVRKASALPGVRAILTGQDVPALLMPGTVWDQPLLAYDRVRYAGEPVALIAADRPEVADEAARLIEITYEPLPVLTDPEAAMQPGAMLLHENWASYQAAEGLVREGNVCCHATLRKGDVARGFAEADLIFEDSFSTESVHQSHVEPRVAIGLVDSAGQVTVYSNTQLPYWIRTNVAHAVGAPESDVRIIPTGIGGGFGSKLYPQIEPFVALLARKAGRPVRLVIPLEEEIMAGLPRHPCKLHLKTGVKKDGTLVAREARMILDTGAYAGSGPELASIGVLVLGGPYRTPHLKLEAYAVHTNKMNFGAYRGPAGPQAVFALESHFDVVAEKLGLDPLEFRLKNIVEEGDEAPNGQVLRGVGLRECLEKTAAAIEWGKPAPPSVREASSTGPMRGKGLSCGWWTTTGGLSMSRVRLDAGGKVVVTVGTQEIGTGAIMGGVPQVVAEMMGVGLEDVRLVVADTASGLYDFGSQGSRTLFNVGRAAQFACADLIRQIKDLAEKMLEVPAAELELREGAVAVKGSPGERISLAQLAQLDTKGSLQGRGESFPDPAVYDTSRLSSCLYPAFHYPSFHCHAAEVEVDPGTGAVRVVRYAAAHDVGYAANPTLAEGQIHGGVAQGIGMALMEEIVYRDGHVINNNWTDYKLPTIADVPDVQAILVQHPVEGGPFGAKGLGESPVIHPPAALANAIAHATGVRLTSLPITAEKILRALKEKHG
ncbi:MAG: aldehyde oxidase and xanthine dehydrogenase molybdopterin binding protein [Anaerolineales bacterium]|nr:aldehyde oxidase and xanthine dehydrogenase molybdopterin binding protein [Anaerolineales bacterium]MBM2848463.1 aldehyde oxidase and xanthine dehydrogenase molybdopterin binding protein [Anaerolineales bacterium]